MLARCSQLTGGLSGEVSGGTFHSLANSLLRYEAKHLGLPSNYGIMDQDDAENLIGRIRNETVKGNSYSKFPQRGAILNVISQAINRDMSIKNVVKEKFRHFIDFIPDLQKISEAYKAQKLKNAVMDFDDLLVGLEQIMRENEEVRVRIAARYQHILVDEYQDTNAIQARLTWLLGKDHLNVTAVGDEAQSIYAFRGASFRNIMDFPITFSGATVLKLEDNYRSVAPILDLAGYVLEGAREKYDKKLRSIRGAGKKPIIAIVNNLQGEAIFVVEEISRLVEAGTRLDKIAVLFRAASHSFELEVQLAKNRIPYTKFGGRKFLETAHIKDFLSFLKVASNPFDNISLRRLFSMLPGVGPKGSQAVADWASGRPDIFNDISGIPLRGKARKQLPDLAKLLSVIIDNVDEVSQKAHLVYDYYQEIIKELYPDDYPVRQRDIEELLRMADNSQGLRNFLSDLTLDPPNSIVSGSSQGRRSNDLTLSTIHSAKGLEWDYVFLLSAVEGRFPPSYGAKTPEESEEERRLMYVAVTRAKDNLVLTLPLDLSISNIECAKPSRFLSNIPDNAVVVLQNNIEIELHSIFGTTNKFTNWLYNFSSDLDVGIDPEPSEDSIQKFEDSESDIIYEDDGDQTIKSVIDIMGKNKCQQHQRSAKNPTFIPEVGQIVNHNIFGLGKVLCLSGSYAYVKFDLVGKKRILWTHALLSLV
jgi:DNA helicase-2/ATP-dependent DNA helicase PcrA